MYMCALSTKLVLQQKTAMHPILRDVTFPERCSDADTSYSCSSPYIIRNIHKKGTKSVVPLLSFLLGL